MRSTIRVVCVAMLSVLLCAGAAAVPKELAFRVVDAQSGDPVPRARVNISMDGRILAAITDLEGECVIPYPEKGVDSAVQLTVTARGHVPTVVEWRLGVIGVGDLPAQYTLRLEPGAVMGGIVQTTDGKPVEGATVGIYVQPDLTPNPGGPTVYPALTDHSVITSTGGRWTCDIMPSEAQKIRLRVQLPGQTFFRTFTYTEGGELAIESLRKQEAVVAMEKRFAVEGVVHDTEGNPARKPSIILWPVSGKVWEGFETEGGSDGRFSVANVEAGEYRMIIGAEECALHMETATLQEGMDPLEITVEPGHVLKGRVEEGPGKPVPDALVSVSSWRGYDIEIWQTLTDEEGRFEWTGAPEDEVEIVLYKEGRNSPDPVTLRASNEEHVLKMDFMLQLAGEVTDAETGEPIPEFLVIQGIDWNGTGSIDWLNRDPQRESDGVYMVTFDGSYPAYAIRIEADGYQAAVSPQFKTDEGEQTFDAALKPGLRIRGLLRMANGEPASGAEVIGASTTAPVTVRDGSIENREDALAVRTNGEGQFQLPAVEEVAVVLILHDEGHAETTPAELEASPEVMLVPWSGIEGQAVIGGKLMEYEYVTLRYERAPGPGRKAVRIEYRTMTDGSGNFEFGSVPDGEAVVALETEAGGSFVPTNETYVELAPGEAVKTKIGGVGQPVSGRVKPPEGVALDFARCKGVLRTASDPVPYPEDLTGDARDAWYAEWWASDEGKAHRRRQHSFPLKLDDTGRFSVSDVPEGDYLLEFTLCDSAGKRAASLRQEVRVAASPVDLGPFQAEPIARISADATGLVAPDFTVETLDGQSLSLYDLRGSYVLLEFWASWCGPCRGETPLLKAVHEEFAQDDRFVMAGLSLDETKEAAKAYVDKHGIAWTQGFLGPWPLSDVPDAFGIKGIPAILLIDPEGKVISRNLRGEATAKAVREALGGSEQ